MHQPLIPHRLVLALIALGVLLPMVVCIILGVAALLGAMGDAQGGTVLRHIALAGGIIWTTDLVCLVLVLAIGTLRWPDDSE
jgi:hypothetical protein